MLDDIMTPEQLKEVREYNRIGLRCTLLDRAIDVAFLALVAFWWATPIMLWLKEVFPILNENSTLSLLVLVATVVILHATVSLPLSFYNGWVVEKRYGLSNLSALHWFRRYMRRIAFAAVINAILMLILVTIVYLCGPWWWAVVSVVFFFLSVLLVTFLPTLGMRFFYHIEKLDEPTLLARLEELVRPTPLKLSGIYRLDLSVETQKANAMLAGFGRSRRVLLGDTLLKNFTEDEIVGVFAHEVGHQVRHHIPKLLATMFFLSLGIFWLADVGLRLWFGAGTVAPMDYVGLPTTVVTFFMFATTLIGQIIEPIQNGISRKFEREADVYAVEHCGNREALRSAFVKLAIQNKADPNPPKWEVFWLHSHPAIGERIESI